MKNDVISTIEVCVYGKGQFLEFVHGGRFATLEVRDVSQDAHLAKLDIRAIKVEVLKPGGGHQMFERVTRHVTERRIVFPGVLCDKIIAFQDLFLRFANDGPRFRSQRHPYDELLRIIREDLEAIMFPRDMA